MMRACLPLSRKNSPIAQPEYGARYCRGAASEAVALTTMVYIMAPAEKHTQNILVSEGYIFVSVIKYVHHFIYNLLIGN